MSYLSMPEVQIFGKIRKSWKISGKSGKYLENIWKISGKYLENLENISKISGKYLENLEI